MHIILIKKIIIKLIKNIKVGKSKLFSFIFLLLISLNNNSFSSEVLVEIKVLDKVSAKNVLLTIKINQERKYKNLLIKPLKCKNSEFDDNPEVTAYLQVIDITKKSNDQVFIFNGWTFASSPSLRPFDHPVYDIWLIGCK